MSKVRPCELNLQKLLSKKSNLKIDNDSQAKKVSFTDEKKICKKCNGQINKSEDLTICKECFNNCNVDLLQKLTCNKCKLEIKLPDVILSCNDCYSDIIDDHYDEFMHVLLAINIELEKLKNENTLLKETLSKPSDSSAQK